MVDLEFKVNTILYDETSEILYLSGKGIIQVDTKTFKTKNLSNEF